MQLGSSLVAAVRIRSSLRSTQLLCRRHTPHCTVWACKRRWLVKKQPTLLSSGISSKTFSRGHLKAMKPTPCRISGCDQTCTRAENLAATCTPGWRRWGWFHAQSLQWYSRKLLLVCFEYRIRRLWQESPTSRCSSTMTLDWCQWCRRILSCRRRILLCCRPLRVRSALS